MAKSSIYLVDAFRKTAKMLAQNKPYEWGHMGSCNCGNLAQVILNMSKAEIHRYAMEKNGDWSEQVNDYCPSSNLPMDQLIFSLLEKGLSTQDLHELEFLKNREVLDRLGVTHLTHNNREHVIRYFEAWADMLEEEYLSDMRMPEFITANLQSA